MISLDMKLHIKQGFDGGSLEFVNCTGAPLDYVLIRIIIYGLGWRVVNSFYSKQYKIMKKRGRPLKYDHDEALDKAIQVFWSKGLTATSLDDLADAMNMNRPSIYNAFGNKISIYRKAFARFVSQLGEQLDGDLFGEPDLNKAMKQFYSAALDTYFQGTTPLGCFVTCTAIVEAATCPEIKKDLDLTINKIDTVIEKRLLAAQQEGSWAKDGDAKNTAKLLHATLQSLAVRARGGESRASLKAMYSSAVDMVC